MSRTLTFAAILLLSACSPQKQEAQPANDAASETAAAPVGKEVPKLEGQWRIATIDGKPIGADTVASFAGGKVTVSSGCVRRAWSYTQKGNVVSFATDPGGSANCGGGPSGNQEAAYDALEKASIAIFGKDGAEASLSGNGGVLALERR